VVTDCDHVTNPKPTIKDDRIEVIRFLLKNNAILKIARIESNPKNAVMKFILTAGLFPIGICEKKYPINVNNG
jgi:hypothetical protein